jgi:outer membrane autotransporter protein
MAFAVAVIIGAMSPAPSVAQSCGGISNFAPCPDLTPAQPQPQASLQSPTPQVSSNSERNAEMAATQGALRDVVGGTVTIIENRLRDITHDIVRGRAPGSPTAALGLSGLAAGSEPMKYGVWVDASGSYLSNDSPGHAYQGRTVTALSGIDAVIGQSWVAGFSAGYTNAALSVLQLDGTRRNDGAIAGPYLSYIIDQNFTIDGNFTYGRLSNDVTTGPVATSRHFSSHRYAASVNGNYFTDVGPVSLVGFGGYSYAFEHAAGATDSTGIAFAATSTRYGAIKLGGEISYPLGNFEPYLPLTYEFQTTAPTDGVGRNAVILGAGLRYRYGDRLTIGILATTEQVRSHQQDDTIGANLRYSF